MTRRTPRDELTRGRRLVRLVRRYGWRAYALPILAVITVIALLEPAGGSAVSPASGRAAPQPAVARTEIEGAVAGSTDFQAGSTPQPVTLRHETESDSCAGSHDPRRAVVSISQQHLWLCDGARQVYSTPVTTGATVNGDQTPTGSWRVQAKQRNRYLVGPGYKDYVRYWVPFNGDFGFHDASWQTMTFGSAGYHTLGSHGCVHLPTPAMKWLYSWAKVGVTVVTVAA